MNNRYYFLRNLKINYAMNKEKMFTNLQSDLNIKEPLLQNELARDSIIEFVPKNSQLMKQVQFVKWFTIIVTGEIRVWHQYRKRQNQKF